MLKFSLPFNSDSQKSRCIRCNLHLCKITRDVEKKKTFSSTILHPYSFWVYSIFFPTRKQRFILKIYTTARTAFIHSFFHSCFRLTCSMFRIPWKSIKNSLNCHSYINRDWFAHSKAVCLHSFFISCSMDANWRFDTENFQVNFPTNRLIKCINIAMEKTNFRRFLSTLSTLPLKSNYE